MWDQVSFVLLLHFKWSTEIHYAICQEIQMLVSDYSSAELWVKSHFILCEILKLWAIFVVSWANIVAISSPYSSVTTQFSVL